MENELVYKDLSYMEVLRDYSFESKMLACPKYASRIMDISEVSMSLACRIGGNEVENVGNGL